MILNFQLNTCSNKVSKYLNIKINDAPSIQNIFARTKSLHHAMSKVSQLNNRTLRQIHHMAIVTKYFTTQWENPAVIVSSLDSTRLCCIHVYCCIMSLKQAFKYLNFKIIDFLTNVYSFSTLLSAVRCLGAAMTL